MATARQLILQAFADRLATIRAGVAPFVTNVGQSVFIGETPALSESFDPPCAVAIVPADDIPGTESMANIIIDWPVEIQAVAKADLDQPWLTVEQVLGDIKRAVEIEDRTLGLGPRMIRQRIRRSVTRTLQLDPGATVIGAGIVYLVPYVEGWGTP